MDRHGGPRKTMDELMKIMDEGDNKKFDFKRYYQGELLNLDFSGFLRKVFNFIDKHGALLDGNKNYVKNLAASFQESLTEILSQKIMKMAAKKHVREDPYSRRYIVQSLFGKKINR